MKSFLFFLILQAMAGVWDNSNNPYLLRLPGEKNLTTKLSSLPNEGKIDADKWSGDYWAHYNYGAAHMFQGKFVAKNLKRKQNEDSSSVNQRKRKLININNDLEEIVKLTAQDIRDLPLAERAKLPATMKLDFLRKEYDFPLTTYEFDRTGWNARAYKKAMKKYDIAKSKKDKKGMQKAEKEMNSYSWQGICNGWGPASIKEETPQDCVVKEIGVRDGVDVPFHASDIKALLSLMYAEYNGGCLIKNCGKRCYSDFGEKLNKDKIEDETYMDLNPGSFHVLLGNKVGLQKLGFIIDVDTSEQVWNQGIISYNAKMSEVSRQEANNILAKDGAQNYDRPLPSTHKFMKVTNDVTYLVETAPLDASQETRTEKYEYILELKNDNIIGGRWINGSLNRHPDFAWDIEKVNPLKNEAGDYFGKPFQMVLEESRGVKRRRQDR